ncbi:hypothetical protein B0H14DRAFT_3161932 [Mycena olivaceomarginata]|nr:hypothetical protein B0H14DRAFT_3161932 [Mycena olivaceomarginata]
MATRNVQDSPATQLSESNPPMQNARMAATDNWAEQTASCVAPFLTLDLRGGRACGKAQRIVPRMSGTNWGGKKRMEGLEYGGALNGREPTVLKRALRRGVMNVVAKLVDGVRCWEEKAYRELGGRERQREWKWRVVEGTTWPNERQLKEYQREGGNEERKTSCQTRALFDVFASWEELGDVQVIGLRMPQRRSLEHVRRQIWMVRNEIHGKSNVSSSSRVPRGQFCDMVTSSSTSLEGLFLECMTTLGFLLGRGNVRDGCSAIGARDMIFQFIPADNAHIPWNASIDINYILREHIGAQNTWGTLPSIHKTPTEHSNHPKIRILHCCGSHTPETAPPARSTRRSPYRKIDPGAL